jgi:hypothetical protein
MVPQMLARHRRIVAAALCSVALALPIAASGAGSPPGPSCVPARPDPSAQLDGAVTVSPTPGALDAQPQTQISFLGVPAAEISGVTVIGSRSGIHEGRFEAYSQGDGGSFLPNHPFFPGERVSVTASLASGGRVAPLDFDFGVAVPDSLQTVPATGHAAAPGGQQHFRSRPDLQPPIVTVHTRSAAQPSGDVLLAPYGVPEQGGPMILDHDGGLVWFEPLPAHTEATNLRVQQLDGVPVLTWWQGEITNHGFGLGVDEIVGTHYQSIAQVRAGNGVQADLHEFQITPAGTALLTAYYPILCDLSSVGGAAASAVTDSLFQEIDIKTGLVTYQWSSLDHVPLSSSYAAIAGTTTSWPFDYFHLNSINLDPDGTLLISSRNTWTVYDIDAATGQIVWQLGGKDSSFAEGQGAATVFQHDARPVGGDEISLFDNGASPQFHAQSRGVVLALNLQSHTVTRELQFLHPGHPLLADSQGSLEALPGGDWLVGWGQEPDFSEFSSGGTLLFDASLPPEYESYRVLSYPWAGEPDTVPALAVDGTDAYVSWNGDTQTARWALYEGASAGDLVRIGSVARDGFETAIPLERGLRYVAVRALGASGATLATSRTLAIGG